jgi:hypothetical protein
LNLYSTSQATASTGNILQEKEATMMIAKENTDVENSEKIE